MGMKQLTCTSCYGKWQDVQWSRKRSQSRGIKRTEDKTESKSKSSALSPFRAGTTTGAATESGAPTPWVPTSPALRTPTPKPEAAEKSGKGSGKSAQEEGKDQLAKVLQAIPGITDEAKVAIQKVLNKDEETGPIKPTHVYKIDNLRKTLSKQEEKLRALDGEWKNFQARMKQKFEEQRKGFLEQREELVKLINEKQMALDSALADMKTRALAEKSSAINLEDDDVKDDVTLPWDVEMDKFQEPEDFARATSPMRKIQKVDPPTK